MIVTVFHCQLRARPERSQVRFCQNCGGKVRMVRPCRTSKVSKRVSNRLRTRFDLIFEDPNPKMSKTCRWMELGIVRKLQCKKHDANKRIHNLHEQNSSHVGTSWVSLLPILRHVTALRSREAWISSISCFISSLVRNHFVIRPDARWSTLEFVYFGQFLRSEVWGA